MNVLHLHLDQAALDASAVKLLCPDECPLQLTILAVTTFEGNVHCAQCRHQVHVYMACA